MSHEYVVRRGGDHAGPKTLALQRFALEFVAEALAGLRQTADGVPA